jgi:hypothetical protein
LILATKEIDSRSYYPPLVLSPEALLAVLRKIGEREYRPTRPLEPDRESQRQVSRAHDAERIERAIRLVDAIRDRAIELGWSLDRLYRQEGYPGRSFLAEYGLVCYIPAEGRLGEVTRQWIEIIGPPPAEVCQRFHNPDVEQPWIVKVNPQKK